MQKRDEKAAGVSYDPKIYSFLLRNWRHFSRDFEFSPQRITGAWQSLFDITLPRDVKIIPKPGIRPYHEIEERRIRE
jgi:hypothetical protein